MSTRAIGRKNRPEALARNENSGGPKSFEMPGKRSSPSRLVLILLHLPIVKSTKELAKVSRAKIDEYLEAQAKLSGEHKELFAQQQRKGWDGSVPESSELIEDLKLDAILTKLLRLSKKVLTQEFGKAANPNEAHKSRLKLLEVLISLAEDPRFRSLSLNQLIFGLTRAEKFPEDRYGWHEVMDLLKRHSSEKTFLSQLGALIADAADMTNFAHVMKKAVAPALFLMASEAEPPLFDTDGSSLWSEF